MKASCIKMMNPKAQFTVVYQNSEDQGSLTCLDNLAQFT